ncbi:MAG: GntR family transcriptional regulator [Robiginitomaculum sp.]|nr:MAG: GntR family transcriptional regulator [Robiginitomaculum sp.]
MQITIDIDDHIPLFAQLVAQIKQAVLGGSLSPADAMPSIRQLANDLDLNNKTVAKAYRLLERDGVIEAKGYRGSFVHPNAKVNSAIDLNEWALAKLGTITNELRDGGVTDSEIRNAFVKAMNNQNTRDK